MKNIPFELESLEEIPFNSEVCIYGSGKQGLDLYNLIKKSRKDIHIKYFLDSFCSKTLENGAKQIKFSSYNVNKDEIIIIASCFSDQIIPSIRKRGIDNFTIYKAKDVLQVHYEYCMDITSLVSQDKISVCEKYSDLPKNKKIILVNISPEGSCPSAESEDTIYLELTKQNYIGAKHSSRTLSAEFSAVSNVIEENMECDTVVINAEIGNQYLAVNYAKLFISSKCGMDIFIFKKDVHSRWRGLLLPGEAAGFVYIPKCGSSSFLHSLRLTYEDGYSSSNQDAHESKSRSSILRDYSFAEADNIFIFTIIRNPFHRLASLYNSYKVKGAYAFMPYLEKYYGEKPLSFESFVQFTCTCPNVIAEEHFKSQYTYITDNESNVFVNKIFNLNAMEQNIFEINAMLKKKIKLLHRNRSNINTDYMTVYYGDSEIKRMVAERYSRDIEVFEKYAEARNY